MDDYICWNKHGEEEDVNNGDGGEGLHVGGNDEAPSFGNEELSNGDVSEIIANPIPMVESLEELMVHDVIDYDELRVGELKKLKRLLIYMKSISGVQNHSGIAH